MNKSRVIFLILSACVVVPLLGSGLLFGAPADDDAEGDSIYKYLSIFREVLKLVREQYVEEADIRALMSGALDGASDALDQMSVFVPSEQVAGYDRALKVGRDHTGLLLLKDRGVAYVVAVEDGSPGETAGILQGDIVSEVNGLSSRSMPLWQIRQTLSAEIGTQIVLELVRAGATEEVTLALGQFDRQAPTLSEVEGVAVLRIPEFSSATAAKVKELVLSVSGKPMLLDLRGVAGGDPEVAYDVAELFAAGDLGQLKARSETVARYSSEVERAWSGSKLGVLVNHGSQGSSEILAAVLNQRSDALVLGDRSFGHAGRSERLMLSDGVLELTSAFYTGPDGEPLNKSLVPDVRVDRRRNSADDEGDPYLGRAIELFLIGAEEDEQKVA